MAKERPGRGSREATVEAILDAAEALFSAHGFTAVTVRDIAERAGVSHALVHRYLGSKEEVYRAVFRRNEDVIRAAAGDTEDLLEAVRLMLREGLRHHRAYLRLVAHSAVHGLPFDSTIGRFAATERLVELAQRRAVEHGQTADDLGARFAIAAVVALYLGWTATGDWVLRAAGLADVDEDTAIDGLERIILGIVEREVPGAFDR